MSYEDRVKFESMAGKVFTSVVQTIHGSEDAIVFTVSDDEEYVLYHAPD